MKFGEFRKSLEKHKTFDDMNLNFDVEYSDSEKDIGYLKLEMSKKGEVTFVLYRRKDDIQLMPKKPQRPKTRLIHEGFGSITPLDPKPRIQVLRELGVLHRGQILNKN